MYPYIDLFGKTIGTYGLCMTAAVLVVFLLAGRDGKKRDFRFEDLLIVGATALGIGLVGAGLLYIVVTYPIDQIIAMIKAGDFSFIGGGLVFYGGLIAGALGAVLGMKIARCRFSNVEPCVVPYLPLGHAIGRVGCFLAGCCHGVAYDGCLAVHYPNSIAGLPPEQGYFPTQLLEAVLNIGVCFALLAFRSPKRKPGQLLAAYAGFYGIVRFIVEYFRGDAIRGSLLVFSTSQWISIGMMAASVLFFVITKARKSK
jgi:phosphatidylglycerol:prolipoprotein diacylglycerol transferase